MTKSGIFVLLHAVLVLLAAVLGVLLVLSPAELGTVDLGTRALIVSVPVLAALIGVRGLLPWAARHTLIYLLVICLPVASLVPLYYLVYLPSQLEGGLSGEQLASSLITENTSNGIIEVGFAYPIFTPTISLTNNELFTRDVDIYLRMLDGNSDPALFRAVRDELPDSRLSVEASVRGLLSESAGYLFIPVAIPPGRTVSGQVIFIISDLNDGSTFSEALGRRYPAEFQIRDPESGDLLLTIPMDRIY